MPVAFEVTFDSIESICAVAGFGFCTVKVRRPVLLESLAVLNIRARLKMLSQPGILGRRIDHLADALAGVSPHDPTNHRTNCGADRAGERAGSRAAGSAYGRSADAGFNRVRT